MVVVVGACIFAWLGVCVEREGGWYGVGRLGIGGVDGGLDRSRGGNGLRAADESKQGKGGMHAANPGIPLPRASVIEAAWVEGEVEWVVAYLIQKMGRPFLLFVVNLARFVTKAPPQTSQQCID